MQAQGGRAFGLSFAGALLGSLGANALASSLLPAEGAWLAGGIGLQLTANAGISFGLAAGASAWLVTATGALALGAAAYLLRGARGIGLGLLIGGGLANLLDRLVDGRVTDYVAVGPWPTFNAADVCITVGAVLILTHLLRRR